MNNGLSDATQLARVVAYQRHRVEIMCGKTVVLARTDEQPFGPYTATDADLARANTLLAAKAD